MNYTILIPSPSLRVGMVPSRNNQNHRFMDSLKFIETMSVADFKIKMGVERIDVKQNPHTGKCFFVFGCETGAVSERNRGYVLHASSTRGWWSTYIGNFVADKLHISSGQLDESLTAFLFF